MDQSSLVSVQWLNSQLGLPNLVILDATLAKPKATIADIPNIEHKIPGTRFFDIDNRFSDKSIDLPHMMCDAAQFKAAADELGISNDSMVIVYDAHGIYSSPRAWWMLKSMGIKNVAVLDGGLPEWMRHGFRTEPVKKHGVFEADFQPIFNSSCFVDATYVASSIENEDVCLLDARSNARFDGTAPEPRAGLRSGHIPNSISLPFIEVLDDTRMKSSDQLKKLFAVHHLGDKKLVFSCGSGLTACIILLAAHLAGYEDLAVFDGSWSEWGQQNGLPVVTD